MPPAQPVPEPGPGDDSLRIGDAERSAAAAALGRHWTAGRLSPEEFDQRTAGAWGARTGRALNELFRDLPADVDVLADGRRLRVAAAVLTRLTTRLAATSRRRLAAGATVAALAVVSTAALAGGQHDDGPCRAVQASEQHTGADDCLAADGR